MDGRSTRGIREEDVWQAADQLLHDGLRPTIERVRHKIGRGSPNTVSPMLENWFATLGKRLFGKSDQDLPPGAENPVPAIVLQTAHELWSRAQEDAKKIQSREITAQRNELEMREAELGLKQAELAQKEAALEQTRSSLEGALTSARQVLGTTQAHMEEAVRGRQDSEARVKQLEQSLAQAQGALERLRAETTAQQAAWSESVRQAELVHTEREKRLLLEVDRERLTARHSNAELLRERKLRERVEESLREATQDLGALRNAMTLVEAAQARAQEDIQVWQERRDELQKRLSIEENAHQATRALLATALTAKPRGRRPAGA